MRYDGLDEHEARAFCDRWLPAWTGNDPGRLAGFYAEDAFYADPARPDGLRGQPALLAYFASLLRRNPDWRWTHRRSDPLPGGFLNHWTATIPTPDGTCEVQGVCVVQLRDGLIVRNEVFFDRTALQTTAGPAIRG